MVKFGVTGLEELQTVEPSHVLASDLADGRLEGDAFGHAVEIVCADPAGLQAWHMVHLVGDAMRSRELAGRCLDGAFAQAVQEQLAAETFDPSPDVGFAPTPDAVRSAPVRAGSGNQGANDWNWALVAGVGAVAVALTVALSMGGLWPAMGGSASVAMNGAPVVLSAPAAPVEMAATVPVLASVPSPAIYPQATPQVMIRDPRRVDELLAAHRQLGGTSALQKPAGFFRSAAHQEEGSR